MLVASSWRLQPAAQHSADGRSLGAANNALDMRNFQAMIRFQF
jgi:hypothetical protein